MTTATPSPSPAATEVQRRVIIGTAGHIDHGKTTLIQALTGIDCDRWEEEKRRGITIDLGFAHMVEGDLQIGFIDVPGHERLLHNALAGLGGIRVVLLVVAANEGVMAQTREHLEVCSLLEIPHALVALTKTDLVAPDLMELAQEEVRELLETTHFAGAQVLPVSSQSGEGLKELRAHLVELAAGSAIAEVGDSPARLPVDRAFQLKGLGSIVTGTLASGKVEVGDSLELLPGNTRVGVRSLQVHGAGRQVASHGERTSIQLSGISTSDLHRGLQAVTPGSFETTVSLLVRMRLAADFPQVLEKPIQIRFHLLSGDAVGWVRPVEPATLSAGESGLVEVRLDEPLVAIRSDRFICRWLTPAVTLGGGEILDPSWRRVRGPALPQALEALTGDLRSAVHHWVRVARYRGATAAELAARAGVSAATVARELEALGEDGSILRLPGDPARPRWLARSIGDQLQASGRRVLERYFKSNRLAHGMAKAEMAQKLAPGMVPQLARQLLLWLEETGDLELEGDRVLLPGRTVELSDLESNLADAVLERFRAGGLEPPPLEDMESLEGADRRLDMVVRYLLENDDLQRLPNRELIASSAVSALRDELRDAGWERFSVPQFKEHFGLTRKWAIPLLEHLDSLGVTRRSGDERLVASDGTAA